MSLEETILLEPFLESLVLPPPNEKEIGVKYDSLHWEKKFAYYDELYGGPAFESTSIPHTLQCLMEEMDTSHSNCQEDAMLLMTFYPKLSQKIIKPMLTGKKQLEYDYQSIESLWKYEVILSFLAKRISSDNPNTNGESKFKLGSILNIIPIVSNDVIIATNAILKEASKQQQPKKDDIAIYVISLLLRSLIHMITIISHHTHNINNINSPKSKIQEMVSFMTLTALTFLPFSSSSNQNQMTADLFSSSSPSAISAKDILPIPYLQEQFSLSITLKDCALPPTPAFAKMFDGTTSLISLLSSSPSNLNNGMEDSIHTHPNFLQTSFLDLKTIIPTHDLIWAKSGILRRVANHLLQSIYQNFVISPSYESIDGKDYTNISIGQRMEAIVKFLGQDSLSRSCRTFFFDKSTKSNILPENEDDDDINSTYFCPSRIQGTIICLFHLSFPLSRSSLQQILPICYTLMDHPNFYNQSVGTAMLLHILRNATSTNLFEHWENLEHISYSVWKSECREKVWNMASITLLRTELMKMLKDHDTSHQSIHRKDSYSYGSLSSGPLKSVAVKRREFTLDLFVLLKKRVFTREKRGYEDEDIINLQAQSNKHGEDFILPILMNGICPLLSQHAEMGSRKGSRRRDSDAMEISTEGIHSLLLLLESLDWEIENGNITDETLWTLPIATMVAMVSFLMSTYPAMKYHGGKIMCAILSSLGYCDKNIENYKGEKVLLEYANTFVCMAVHTASVALILCGDRADKILSEVEEKCIDSLASRCRLIRERSKALLDEQKQI